MVLDAGQQAIKDQSILGGKTDFIEECRTLAVSFDQAKKAAQDLRSRYFDNGYNGVAHPDGILDVDMIDYRFEPADIGSFMTALEQYVNLLDNAVVVQGDYDSVVNNII